MSSGIGEKISQGLFWFYVLRISSRLINTLRLLILARFLSPTDFGLMGVVLLVLSFLDIISTTGFDQALIQKKENIRDHFDTVWYISILRGLVLGVLIFFTAPLAADFFQEPLAVPLIRIMAVSPIIIGFRSPGLIEVNRRLNFKKIVLFDFARALIVAAAAIVTAFLFRNVYALLVASLLDNLLMIINSFLIYPYLPGRDFRIKQVKNLWGFGRWVFGSRIAHYLFNDGDDWFVGRFLGTQALGFYQNAYNFGCAPMTEITGVFSKVIFPAFSSMQENRAEMRAVYLRVLQITMLLSTPIALGIFVVATDAVQVLLGSKWLPMVASLQVLVFWGWIRSFRATTGPILLANGRPDAVTKFTVIKVLVLAAIIYPISINYGILGTSWAVLIAAVVEIPLILSSMVKIVGFNPGEIIAKLLQPLSAGITMVILLTMMNLLIGNWNPIIKLSLLVAAGAGIYILLTYVLDRLFKWGIADLIKSMLQNLRSSAPDPGYAD